MKYCKIIRDLARNPDPPCLSLYLDLHGNSADAEKARDQSLCQTEELMKAHGIPRDQILTLLEPLPQMLDSIPADETYPPGIAIFRSPSRFEILHIPYPVPNRLLLRDHFHFEPLLPLLAYNDSLFVLMVDEQFTRLLEMNRYLTEELTPKIMPQNPLAARQLEVPSPKKPIPGNGRGHDGHQVNGANGSNGHGDLEIFCNAVGRITSQRLRHHHEPLYLCTNNSFAPAFLETTSIQNLRPHIIPLAPGPLPEFALRAAAWSIHDREEADRREALLSKARSEWKRGQALNEIGPAMQAAKKGDVELAVLKKKSLLQSDIRDSHPESYEELDMGDAVMEAIGNGARLLLAEEDELPEGVDLLLTTSKSEN